MELQEIKDAVVKLLVTEHDMLLEEAESAVEESITSEVGMWNVNAEAENIAKYLASDEDND